MYWIKVSTYYAVLAIVVVLLLQLWNMLSMLGQVVFLCVLAVVCLVLKGNWTKILLAEFFVSDHYTRDSTVYWRHGLSCCSLVGFRVAGKRLVDFNSLFVDGVRKVFVFYNKGSCYLIFEVHGFTLSRLEERLHRVERLVSRLGLDFSEGKFVSVSVEEEEREVPVIIREDFDLNFNLGESYLIVVEKGGRVKDLEERGVLSGNPIRVGLYYVRKGVRDIRCLKAYAIVSDFEASVLAKCFFENSSLVKPVGYKIGYRMVGKRIVFSDKVYFNPCYHTYICGTTQSGKSTLIALISSLVSHDYPVLVIDWNGGFRGLPGEVLLAGRDVSFNPFSELGPEKAVEVIGSAVEYAFGEERGFTPMQYYLLKQVVYDIASKGEVTLEKVYEEILRRIQQTRKEDEKNALAAILRRLATVVNEAFSGTRPLRIPERGIVVVDLSLLGTELSKVLFALVLLEWLFRMWTADKKTLFLVIDEVHRISPRDSSDNILELIAKEKLKENIRLILAEQEFRGVSERIFNNCRNIFVFSLVRGEEAARFLGVDLDELRRLEPGECFYWCSGHVVKVKCDFIKLEKPRSLCVVREKPLYVRVEERVRVDEDRALSVAARHGVKFETLKSVLVKLSKEELVKLLEEKDFDKLSALGLWDKRGGRWKRLGRAVLEYYFLLDSAEVLEVS